MYKIGDKVLLKSKAEISKNCQHPNSFYFDMQHVKPMLYGTVVGIKAIYKSDSIFPYKINKQINRWFSNDDFVDMDVKKFMKLHKLHGAKK